MGKCTGSLPAATCTIDASPPCRQVERTISISSPFRTCLVIVPNSMHLPPCRQVERTISIASPCPAGQNLCSVSPVTGPLCSPVSCSLLSSIPGLGVLTGSTGTGSGAAATPVVNPFQGLPPSLVLSFPAWFAAQGAALPLPLSVSDLQRAASAGPWAVGITPGVNASTLARRRLAAGGEGQGQVEEQELLQRLGQDGGEGQEQEQGQEQGQGPQQGQGQDSVDSGERMLTSAAHPWRRDRSLQQSSSPSPSSSTSPAPSPSSPPASGTYLGAPTATSVSLDATSALTQAGTATTTTAAWSLSAAGTLLSAFGRQLPFSLAPCPPGQRPPAANATPTGTASSGCGVWAQDQLGNDVSGGILSVQEVPVGAPAEDPATNTTLLRLGCDVYRATQGRCLPGQYNLT